MNFSKQIGFRQYILIYDCNIQLLLYTRLLNFCFQFGSFWAEAEPSWPHGHPVLVCSSCQVPSILYRSSLDNWEHVTKITDCCLFSLHINKGLIGCLIFYVLNTIQIMYTYTVHWVGAGYWWVCARIENYTIPDMLWPGVTRGYLRCHILDN